MPAPFTRHTGIAAPLVIDNVDTDQIIPSREMTAVSRHGLADGLFAGWRYTAPGSREPDPDFILNRAPFDAASILISGENFGCGSSREHAVWALAEFGIRAIIAKGFGAIFAGNCVRNGVLPVVLAARAVDRLADLARRGEAIEVDLEACEVGAAEGGGRDSFEIDPYSRRLLLEGLDPISLTLQQEDEIDTFQRADRMKRAWAYLE